MLAKLEMPDIHNQDYGGYSFMFFHFTDLYPTLSKYGVVVKAIFKEFKRMKNERCSARHFIQQHIVQPLESLFDGLIRDCGHKFDDDNFPVVSALVNWEFVWDYYKVLEDKEEMVSD